MKEPRIELKYSVRDKSFGLIESWIHNHTAHFKKAFPDRWVNSLYFDNSELDSLRDNYAGISQRCKARYRWYGELVSNSNGNFELKFRNNEVGWKNKYPLEGLELRHGTRISQAGKIVRQGLSPSAAIWMGRFQRPVVIIRYIRNYYVSADSIYRITVDQKLASYSQRFSGRINLNRPSIGLHPSVTIVEVKFAPDKKLGGGCLVRDIPARRSRFSKYVWAASLE